MPALTLQKYPGSHGKTLNSLIIKVTYIFAVCHPRKEQCQRRKMLTESRKKFFSSRKGMKVYKYWMENNHYQGIATGTIKQTSTWLYMWHNCLHLIQNNLRSVGKVLTNIPAFRESCASGRNHSATVCTFSIIGSWEVCTCYVEHLSKLTTKAISAHDRASASPQRKQQSNSHFHWNWGSSNETLFRSLNFFSTYTDKDSSDQDWNTLIGRWTHKIHLW